MQNTEPSHPSPSRPWPIAVTLIVVVAILSFTGYLIFRSIARIPAAAVDQTQQVLEAVQDLAAAFRQGTIETRFVSYAASVSGSTYLQIATVDRVEEFTREDRASIFWGALELPDVVVSATAPVQYTAYVDLEAPWHLRLEDRTLQVTAPSIRFNKPAIDVSRIEFEVREDSFLRDEEAAIAELKRGLTSLSLQRTQELEPLIQDTAREKIENFVRTWILQSFSDVEGVLVEVVFADETALEPPPPRPIVEE